jgi:hypothetical protein
LAAPLTSLCGTLVCRGTQVGNPCFNQTKVIFYKLKWYLFSFQESDVKSTLALLEKCAPFYHSGELTGDCLTYPRPCVRVPPECITHNAIYTILHFLTDDQFMVQQQNVSITIFKKRLLKGLTHFFFNFTSIKVIIDNVITLFM